MSRARNALHRADTLRTDDERNPMSTGSDVNSCAVPTAGQGALAGSCIREITPELRALSGSARWATAMVARRPFFGEADLLRSADQVLASLTADELAEAAGNLGIGEATEAEIREELAKKTSLGLRELHTQGAI